MPKPRYARQELEEAVRTSETMADVLRKVGLVPSGGNYETVWAYIAEWKIAAHHLKRQKAALRDVSDHEIRLAVARSRSFAAARCGS